MAALLWLLIPILGAVVAGAWGSWTTRRRRPAPDAAGVAGYERFRAAMERSSRGGGGAEPHPADAEPDQGPAEPVHR
jgi:hypothetical protein